MKMSFLKKKTQFLMCLLALIFISVSVSAQKMSVSGVVTDPEGEPIIGATVLEKGTSNGTITDFDGNFQIQTSKGAVLVIRYVGYKFQEIPVGTQTTIKVVLREDSELLDDVVVVGYGVVKKNDATGSVTAIKPDEMNKGLNTTPTDMLSGKVAGVSVISDGGAPGSGAKIRIRGGSSLSASNDPLIVIDGLAMDNNGIQGVSNPLSMVNPNDIETFTVLKDASATAIYGSRASNGVIIITTKKGKAGSAPKISYDGNVSISNNKKTLNVGTGDFMRAYAASLYAGKDNVLSKLGTANTDWQDEIYRVALSTDHNLNITGGLKNMPYRVSLGVTSQDGILKTSSMQRGTFSANVSPTFMDKHIKLNANVKAMYIHNRFANTGAIGSAVVSDPTQSVKSSDDAFKNFGGYWQVLNNSNFKDPNWQYGRNALAPANPVAMLEQQKNEANSYSLVGNLEADYKVHGFEDLHIHTNLGADYSSGKQTDVTGPNSGTSTYYGYDGTDDKFKYNLALSTYAQYMKEISELQHFDLMAGYEWQHFYQESTWDKFGMYPSTNEDADKAGTKYNESTGTWKTESYLVSFFGRANYSLLNRYMLTATVRADGTSRFAEDSRWGTFPSIAMGWKIKEESFLKDVYWLSDLKLRLGYGITGQQDIGVGDFPYIPSYYDSKEHANYPVEENGKIVYYPTSRPDAYNPKLKWEETTTYNGGLDFGFLNGRFSGSVDYYYRETNDLINVVDVPAGTNFKNRVISNVGSLTNTGIEVALNTKPIVTKNFTWDLGVNLTHNVNEITKLTTGSGDDYYITTGGISPGTGSNIQAHAVGHPASSFYVYETAINDKGETVPVDRDGNGTINSKDKKFFHSPNADYLVGLTSKMIYKNWDFSFSLRGSVGNYVYNDVLASRSNVGKSGIYSAKTGGFTNVYVPAFDMFYGKVAANADGKMNTDWFYYEDYVQDASFLRVDNITLGYSFKANKLSGRIFATVQNPFVLSPYEGLDPEVFGGIDNNIYPRPMISLVGVSLQF